MKRAGTITSVGSKVTGVGTDFTKLGPRASVMASGEIVAIKEVYRVLCCRCFER